jgi:hypothetical protein
MFLCLRRVKVAGCGGEIGWLGGMGHEMGRWRWCDLQLEQ